MNIEEIHERLIHRQHEIMSIIRKIDKHVTHRDEPFDRDSGERALEFENLDALFAIDSVTRLELRQINDAIERINIGHYGFCSNCGAVIDAARLAALPYIDTCLNCATEP
jgi:RNA polymerase-binding transcription factor DksA